MWNLGTPGGPGACRIRVSGVFFVGSWMFLTFSDTFERCFKVSHSWSLSLSSLNSQCELTLSWPLCLLWHIISPSCSAFRTWLLALLHRTSLQVPPGASSHLSNLHWLPTKHRINFKIARLTYKILASGQAGYLHTLLNTYHSPLNIILLSLSQSWLLQH